MSTATRRSLEVLSVPAASYDQDYGLVGDVWTNFVQICWHFIGPDAVLIFSGFLDRIGTKTDDFTFNHHVQAITICQWLGDGNIEMIFRHFQYFCLPAGR